MDATTSTPRSRRRPLLLQAVAHVEDADSDWLITLRCGHRILRPKGEGRPNVFTRRQCPFCAA
jgi:hypothetical protein